MANGDLVQQLGFNATRDNQDLIGYKVPSASIWGGISQADVTVMGSGESGASVPHPTDPDIIYAQYQYGGLARYDRRTQERVFIAPHPESGEDKYNVLIRNPL